jgi:hypothetical protein
LSSNNPRVGCCGAWSYQTPTTPTTTEGVQNLFYMLEAKLDAESAAGDPCLQKLLHATEKAFADRSLLHDENESLLKQNDEKRVRQNAKSTVISQGDARIMLYADIVKAQQRRTAKADVKKAKLPAKHKKKATPKTSVQEIQIQPVEAQLPPCPGRAPVVQMW